MREVPTFSIQKVASHTKKLSSILPQKVINNRIPSNLIEKVNDTNHANS
jgi:hypothetical protein